MLHYTALRQNVLMYKIDILINEYNIIAHERIILYWIFENKFRKEAIYPMN